MSRKENIRDKEQFLQVGKQLVQEVREAETFSREDILRSWSEIEARSEVKIPATYRIRYYLSGVAASIAILLAVGMGWWFQSQQEVESAVSLSLLEQEIPVLSSEEIVLYANNNQIQLKDESSVKYDKTGKPELTHQVVKSVEKKLPVEEQFNQIVVPNGRKADITFSDGTKIFVNAGSRVIYPAVFAADKREIVVEGEIYLDVKKDPSRPFIVKAKGFEVKVLGTQFNLSAYKEDASASVVLVEGKVEVATDTNEKRVMAPNQLVSIHEKGTSLQENVDVFEYICWKDNMMLLNNRTAGEVFDRLSRRYGRRILCDKQIASEPVSGKLDLRDNIEEVIQILCQSLYLTYEIDKNNNIVISKILLPM